MKTVSKVELFSDEDLERINRCRRALQALTLADIVTGDGRWIRANCMQGKRDPV